MNSEIYKSNILVIDDLEDNLLLIDGILDNEGFLNVHTVLSAKEGIDYLKENKVDIIVLDIMMPVMDGIEACRYIRNQLCLSNVMILLATAKDDIETLKIGLEEAGANDYVRKPFANDIELVSRIKNLLLLKYNMDLASKKEAQLKKSERILMSQSKMAAMGEMIGNIAHQWRQPLSLISTASSGLQLNKELDVLTDEDFEKYTQSIIDNTIYLSTIIDDFRNFYKPNKEKEYFNMKDVMKINLELLSAGLRNNDIEIIEDYEDLTIFSHKNELIQVVINLLNNARDAIIEQKINHQHYIFVKCFKSNNSTIITITDNANGVNENIKCKIFDPYFTTKHQAQGTGLGLYMSKKIVSESLNGQFFIENIEYKYNDIDYKGARFTISIPFNSQ